MVKLVLAVLFVAFAVFLWKLQAQASGRGLRRRSRPLKNDQIDALLARLARAAGIDRVDVRLLPDRSINGLATDTGEIYITQGLFDTFRKGEITARELASVAAHELGHLALGHMRRRMVEVAGRQAAILVLGGVLGRFLPYFGWMISAWVLNLLACKLSRRDEFEADAYATALMVRSGIGAEHQARMLEKLPGLVPGSAAMATSWLASHPPAEERAAAIRENARRWRDHAPQVSD
jgi:putative metalloprotease